MTPAHKHHFTTKMVVRNLAPNTTVDKLNFMFEQYGAVHSVKLTCDVMTGRCGGVAYVAVGEEVFGSARNALDGTRHEGRVIRVSIEEKSGRSVSRGYRRVAE